MINSALPPHKEAGENAVEFCPNLLKYLHKLGAAQLVHLPDYALQALPGLSQICKLHLEKLAPLLNGLKVLGCRRIDQAQLPDPLAQPPRQLSLEAALRGAHAAV